MLIVDEGEAEAYYDGEWQPVGPGAVILVPPGVAHGFRDKSGARVTSHAVFAGHVVSARPKVKRTTWRCAAFRMERHVARGIHHDTGQLGFGNMSPTDRGPDMAGESISLDDLFAQQEQQGLQSIVEAVADRPDHVRITPYAVGAGPLRSYAFVVPKDAVESVTTTGDRDTCCGKNSPVVEVTFADPILNDVLQQLGRAFPRGATRRSPRAAGPAPGSRRRRRAWTDPFHCDSLYQDCFGYCLSVAPYGSKEFYECESVCGEEYWECMWG
ncbi:cupin domain-containing protein [Nonomuraea sp. NPDC050643]|uniref:cupin domain-containing protein n=1 Tax=Nonomuraea sp. NPDC050643 TaxID=3155660 RepID=UPI0033C1CEAE